MRTATVYWPRLNAKRAVPLPHRFALPSDVRHVYSPAVTNEDSDDVPHATLRDFVGAQKLFNRYTLVKILGRGASGRIRAPQSQGFHNGFPLDGLRRKRNHRRKLAVCLLSLKVVLASRLHTFCSWTWSAIRSC